MRFNFAFFITYITSGVTDIVIGVRNFSCVVAYVTGSITGVVIHVSPNALIFHANVVMPSGGSQVRVAINSDRDIRLRTSPIPNIGKARAAVEGKRTNARQPLWNYNGGEL